MQLMAISLISMTFLKCIDLKAYEKLDYITNFSIFYIHKEKKNAEHKQLFKMQLD